MHILNKDIIKIITEWNDWFPDSPGNTFSNIYSSSISLNQNTHVFLCVFSDITSSISLTSGANISLLVEDCSFVTCYSAGNGGAIYFNDGSNCVFSKVCAYQCNTNSGYFGQFCFILVKSGSQYKNIAHLVSVCKCAQYGSSSRSYSIRLNYGNLSLNNVNSSANRCNQYSGIYLVDPSISYTTQSTFSNNINDHSISIYFLGNSHHMSQCNIIRNQQLTTNYGTIYNYQATTTLSGCIIDLNIGAAKIIYVYAGSSITLQNCYLQSNLPTFGTVNIHSPLSDNHSLTLFHFHSQMCLTLIHNVIDDVNILTSNIKYLIDTNMFNVHAPLTLIMEIYILL